MSLQTKLLARLESAYSLIWGTHRIWGGGELLSLYVRWTYFYHPQSKFGKRVSRILSTGGGGGVHSRGACVVGGVCMAGGVHGGGMHGGVMHGRGACMAGACMAGGMHGRGCAWQRGHAWQIP